MSNDNEQTIGMILYSAISPDYDLRTIAFTDRRVLEIPLSKLSELVHRTEQLPSVAASLMEALNPSTFMGLGSIVGQSMWKKLKKKTEGKKVVVMQEGQLLQQLANLAVHQLPYDKINSVKIKKIPFSDDYYLNLGAGFIHSRNIVFQGSEADEVRRLVERTPLAPKIKT